MANYCMEFPPDWKDFLKGNSFKDLKEVYTNGSELIQVYRVEQLIEHLFAEQTQIVRCNGCKHFKEISSEDFGSANICMHICRFVKPDWFCADGER